MFKRKKSSELTAALERIAGLERALQHQKTALVNTQQSWFREVDAYREASANSACRLKHAMDILAHQREVHKQREENLVAALRNYQAALTKKEDVEKLVSSCLRCGYEVTSHQLKDATAKTESKNHETHLDIDAIARAYISDPNLRRRFGLDRKSGDAEVTRCE